MSDQIQCALSISNPALPNLLEVTCKHCQQVCTPLQNFPFEIDPHSVGELISDTQKNSQDAPGFVFELKIAYGINQVQTLVFRNGFREDIRPPSLQ